MLSWRQRTSNGSRQTAATYRIVAARLSAGAGTEPGSVSAVIMAARAGGAVGDILAPENWGAPAGAAGAPKRGQPTRFPVYWAKCLDPRKHLGLSMRVRAEEREVVDQRRL